ncbi:DEAD/DEAH box helicase [Nonomuraea sp. NPDC050328]|uniref:DEAD/DEAH box helicase n=1 Tax=Nonomuraea sp. NPDC050328 TaxID=3364361 RepID=UPI0037979495
MALPLALGGQDLIGQARTGTGKTLAFGIAMLQSIGKPRKTRKKPRGLVVVPTRELAIQVSEDLTTAAGKLGSRVLTVYGGRAYEPQVEALKAGVDVVVGTPGRLLDLVKQKHLDLSQVTALVLDEADRMMDLGFLPDIERIFKLVPAERQTMLFSATMPGEIVGLSRRYLNRPTHVRAEHESGEGEATPQVEQFVWRVHRMDKIEMLGRMLQARERGLTMVFCETKRACDMVSEQLQTRGFAAAAVHGDLGQGQREQALRAFRNGKIDVLVATDVAARGIDIDDVTHVVNYDCPNDEKAYVHRIGRTGRAGRTGISVTFVEWEELTRWKMINQMLGLDFADPVETYSTSPHVYASLNIPEGTKGVLPREARNRAGLDAETLEDLGETGRSRTRVKERDRDRDRDRERPARTPRQRRRTRGGESVGVESVESVEQSQPEVEPMDKRRGRKIEQTPALIGADELPPQRKQSRESASDTAARETAAYEPAVREPAVRESARRAVRETAVREPAREAVRDTARESVREPVREAVAERAPEPVRAAPAFEPREEAPSFLAAPPAPVRREPERIVPASPFQVIFQSPDLATDDDEIAPSAASERQQQRRRPRGNGGGNSGGPRRR